MRNRAAAMFWRQEGIYKHSDDPLGHLMTSYNYQYINKIIAWEACQPWAENSQ
jgi:hypothetical protein